MSTYSLETSLRSCFLSKDIIQQLQQYVLDKAASINNLPLEKIKIKYQIELIDSFGTEKFNSIEEFGRDQFSNDTSRIALLYRNWDGKLRTIKIGFGLTEGWSKIEVEIDGPNARETVTGIVHEVQRVLKDHSNLNFLFHGKYSVFPYVVLGVAAGLAFQLSDKNMIESQKLMTSLISLGLMGLWAIWIIFKKFNPYVIFDTTKNERTREILGWVLKSLAGVVVFGGLAKLIWQRAI